LKLTSVESEFLKDSSFSIHLKTWRWLSRRYRPFETTPQILHDVSGHR